MPGTVVRVASLYAVVSTVTLHEVAVYEGLVGSEIDVDAHLVDHIDKGAVHGLEALALVKRVLKRVQVEREHVFAKPCTQTREFAERVLEARGMKLSSFQSEG